MKRAPLLCVLWLSCTTDPAAEKPLLTVEKLDVANNCFATCPGSADPAAELGLADHCATPAAACGFIAATDQMRVIVDYGDVAVPASTGLQTPTITLVVDDGEQPPPRPLTTPVALGERRHFSSVYYAPEKPSQQLTVRVKAAEGFSAEVGGLSIKEPNPPLDVQVDGCPDVENCSRTADVGFATFTIVAPPGMSERTAALSSVLNGVQQAEIGQAKLTLTDILSGRGTLTVPASNMAGSGTGDSWDVEVSVGQYVQPVHIRLVPPSISVALSGCANAQTCSTLAGEPTTVVVTAPHDIADQQVGIAVDVDGVPTGDPTTKSWNLEGVDTRSAVIPLTAPSQGHTWTIHASVGRYRSDLDIALVAPTLGLSVANCADPCTLFSDVGSASFIVDAPRVLGTASVKLSSQLNGVPQSQTANATLAPHGSDLVEASALLQVPAPNAAQMGPNGFWDVTAQVGNVVQTIQIRLALPTIDVRVPSCTQGGACTVQAGAGTIVTVTVPHDINEPQATLVSTIDGVPFGSVLTQPWSQETTTTRVATFNVTAPATGTNWLLTANVGPMTAQAPLLSLVP